MTTSAFLGVAILACGLLLFARFTRSAVWRATVIPPASIIGSGFLAHNSSLAC